MNETKVMVVIIDIKDKQRIMQLQAFPYPIRLLLTSSCLL